MTAQNQPGPGDRMNAAGNFNSMVTFAYAIALAFLPFTRRNTGKEWMGRAGLLTFFLILGYASFTNSEWMFAFFIMWLAALISQRSGQYRNWRKGEVIHSQYAGDPWLSSKLFPFLSDGNARAMDGFLCLILGGVIVQFDKPVGWFFIAGFFSIMLVEGVAVQATRRKLQAMRDAEIEQRYLARRYKEGRF